MSIRIYNTAPGGGSGGAGTLQQVLNAGHIASTAAGGVATIELEDTSTPANTNVNTPTADIIGDGTNFTEQSATQFLVQDSTAVYGQLVKNKLLLVDAAGDSFSIDFSTGSPVIKFTLIGGDFTELIFAAPTAPNIVQVFKDQPGKIALDPVPNAQTGTTYQFILTDAFNQVTGNNASTQTWTIPANATVALPVGCLIDGLAIGAGKITVAAAAGVTLNSASGNFSSAQWVGFSLWQYAANAWVMIGNLIA